jgi:hypothetical protein
MRVAKFMLAAIMGAALALPAAAQSGPPQGGTSQGGGQQGGQEAVKTMHLKADTLIKQLDKNGDGKITKEEWLASGITERGFNVLDSVGVNGAGGFTPKKLGYITKEIVESFPYKAEMDSNNDGNLTVEKMLAYEKSPAGQPPSGGGQGGSGGGQGGGPGGAPPSN